MASETRTRRAARRAIPVLILLIGTFAARGAAAATCAAVTDVKASGSYAEHVPARAFDCSDETGWNSGAHQGSLTASFVQPETITGVQIVGVAVPETDQVYTIESSLNGVTWSTLASETVRVKSESSASPPTIQVDPTSALHLRVKVDGGASWVAIMEVRLERTTAPPTWKTDGRYGAATNTWAADFDGDGKDDIVSVSASNAYVKLSDGKGFRSLNWTTDGRYGSAEYIWDGDFNGDGKQDIASASATNVFMKLSTGSSFRSENWTTDGRYGSAAYTRIGDFNGDGKDDIASASGTNVFMKLSTGSGFESQNWTTDGRYGDSRFTWVGDFNGDGKADLASARSAEVFVKLSTGSGFVSQMWKTDGRYGGHEWSRAADFNGDGLTDIASAYYDVVYVKISEGDRFRSEHWYTDGLYGSASVSWFRDFNGDGKADIASAQGPNLFLKISRGDGFDSRIRTVYDVWGHHTYIRAGDFDGDGLTDLASASYGDVFMKLGSVDLPSFHTWGRGEGAWLERETQPGLHGAGIDRWLADINGDGRADYVAKSNDGSLHWNLSTGDGFGESKSQSGVHGPGTVRWLADINGDGKADYVAKNNDDKLHWNLATGEGWGPSETQPGLHGIGTHDRWLGDIDGDGKADYVAKSNNDRIHWNLSSGSGWAPNQTQSGVHTPGVKSWLIDVSGDGKADYVTTSNDGTLRWNLSTGSGWGPNRSQSGVHRLGSVATWLADIDGDGRADFVAKDNDRAIRWNLSTGDGWGPSERHDGIHGAGAARWLADINGDGKADYVAKNADRSIYWNLATFGVPAANGARWSEGQSQLDIHGMGSVASWLADINGDGKADFVAKNADPYLHWNLSDFAAYPEGPAATGVTVARAGAFATGVPLPSCDNAWDRIESVGEFVVDEVGALAEDQIMSRVNLIEGLGGALLDGDLEGMADEVIDFSNSQLLSTVERSLRVASLAVDVLPSGAVSNFAEDTLEVAETYGPAVALMANPANTVKGDASEIGSDFVDLVMSLDDPEEFANAYLDKVQKWSPAGSLSYLFTEGDPLEGAKKAGERILRQVDIVTTYVLPFAKAPAAAAKFATKYPRLAKLASLAPGGDLVSSKAYQTGLEGVIKNLVMNAIFNYENVELLNTLADSENQLDEQSTLLLNTLIARAFAEVERGAADAHPLYSSTEIRTVPAEFIGNDRGSGGTHDWALWHPRVEGTDCIALGDYAARHHRPVAGLPVLCGVSTEDTWWSRPIDYKLAWTDKCTGASIDTSIWLPVCEDGYVPVGFVASGYAGSKPLPHKGVCLQNDPSILHWADGNLAGMEWTTNDSGSGAKLDLTVYTREFAGMPLLYATPAYPPNPQEAFLATLEVPAALQKIRRAD